MKTTQFLGIAGALLTASCQQYQQVTLINRDTVRAPNGHWQQIVVFGQNGEGHYVSIKEYNTQKEANTAAQKYPIGTEQRIIGWKGAGYASEYIGGGAVLYVEQYTK